MPEASHRESDSNRKRRARSPARKVAKVFEIIGGTLLCLLIVATPWMFGTTEDWSVRLMNTGAYTAGALFLAAAICNRIAGTHIEVTIRERAIKYSFLAFNLAVLGFCGVALWNARATFSLDERSFNYRDNYNPSLPTTYDADLTRDTLLTLLALCIVFWSIRYWLLQGARRLSEAEGRSFFHNRRFLVLIWILSLNGLAVAIQGILQRLSGSSKLLWFRNSWWGDPLSCFGPFSYRGNAAEFLNLLWPLALGLWWILSRERRRGRASTGVITDGPELFLIPATIVMIAGCIISLSRGGAIVAAGILLACGAIFLFQKDVSRTSRIGAGAFACVVIAAVWFLGWDALSARFKTAGLTDLSGREEIYENARQMGKDFPLYGTGPGTFRSVYHLYRQEAGELWHGFLHDDWLETKVTFGWVGLGLILIHPLILAFWFLLSGRPPVFYGFHACSSLGLIGALVHAKFDFPFQTYSIFFTFVVIAALLTTISPSRR